MEENTEIQRETSSDVAKEDKQHTPNSQEDNNQIQSEDAKELDIKSVSNEVENQFQSEDAKELEIKSVSNEVENQSQSEDAKDLEIKSVSNEIENQSQSDDAKELEMKSISNEVQYQSQSENAKELEIKYVSNEVENQSQSEEAKEVEIKSVSSVSNEEEKQSHSENAKELDIKSLSNEVENQTLECTIEEKTYKIPIENSSFGTPIKTPGKRGRKRKIPLIKNDINNPNCVLDTNSASCSNIPLPVKTPGKRGRKPKVRIPIAENAFDSAHSTPKSNEDNTNEIGEPGANESENSLTDICLSSVSDTDSTPGRSVRKRKMKIYDDNDDPETIKEKKKKRELELKLKNLKCTFNETTEVSGKRQKKPPQRFELQPVEKRKSSFDYSQGRGDSFGSIRWIVHQLQTASLSTLRTLHRLIYRKQGMFAEKQIIKNAMQFSGYPFDESHPEFQRRREQLEKVSLSCLQQLCYMLGLWPGTHEEMTDRILNFLLCPSQNAIEEYVTKITESKIQQAMKMPQKTLDGSFHVQKQNASPYVASNHYQVSTPQTLDKQNSFDVTPNTHKQVPTPQTLEKQNSFDGTPNTIKQEDHHDQDGFPEFPTVHTRVDLNAPWTKPDFFVEGNGVKLKFIHAVISNIEVASDAFVELMHRLFFLTIDEKLKMRRNILEFSGLKCAIGHPNYIYRVRILSVLPLLQLKLICRVLCLPTWHRSRELLTEEIMDFLSVPRTSAMKKREEITFSFDNAIKTPGVKIPELKSVETEEIEIVPDIHIPDDTSSHSGHDPHMENEYLGVKLKNFSNIHYQVISTPASKLNDVHMILYLTTSAQNNIRKNILEFCGFPFEETSTEYQSRRALMNQMNIENLKTVATVLCVSQYICDDSKRSLVDAILKFLLNPAALLNSSTIMPTISSAPVVKALPTCPTIMPPCPVVIKKKATSTSSVVAPCKFPEVKPEIVISSVCSLSQSKDASVKSIIDAMSISSSSHKQTDQIEIERVKACLSNSSVEITPVPIPNVKSEMSTFETSNIAQSFTIVSPPSNVKPPKVMDTTSSLNIVKSPKSLESIQSVNTVEVRKHVEKEKDEPKEIQSPEIDIPLSNVKRETPRVQYFGSDDEDDLPLSKMIGHPNDDQLRALVSKIIKESKLEDITMKHVIRKVFETYPNYDLHYRKEFIKSNVRLILSQMEDQSCSVSTTVITI